MATEPALPPASAPLPEIPGYRLDRILGRGATGTVYRATQLAVDRLVAIKVLHPELAGSKAVRRLQREARTTARLAHPGIVSAIDMGQVRGLWWYAMELIDGPSLSTLLREKGRLSEREGLRLFIPLCEALEHAHEEGVVHRDIKPANILVDQHGRARLVDLGLAFTEDDPLLTRTGGTLGTPHYLSPEQARNPQAVDVRSDIWSLGATMFHALCGRPPFTGESVAEILSGVLYAHIRDPRELEPKLSQGMALVLRKCLTRNAEKRYRTPSELLLDLEALRERRAVVISPRSLDPVAGQAERRRRMRWIAGAVASTTGIVALILWQPWEHQSLPQETNTAVSEPWPPLVALLTRALGEDRRGPGAALIGLDDMRESVPTEYSKDYLSAKGTVLARFDKNLADERKRAAVEYEKALNQERDFVRAQAVVAQEVEERLALELGANRSQRDHIIRFLDFAVLREQAAKEERTALDGLSLRIQRHYDQVILPRARQMVATGEWRDALALLRLDLRQQLESAGISLRGLTPSKVDEQLVGVHLRTAESEARAIESAWLDKDVELERALLARQRAIEADLHRRILGTEAAALIDVAYAEELAARALRPEQMLSTVANRSQIALERARVELAQLQDELAVIDAYAELAAVDAQFAQAWRDRQYPEIAAALTKRMDEEWLRPVFKQLELRAGEAQLLEELLARAASGLSAPGLDSILVGRIVRSGRIVPSADPLRTGFQLEIAGTSESYLLRGPAPDNSARLLGAESIERLAGLASDPKDELASLDRLVRALFRMREGDADGALRAFNSGPLPIDSHAALVLDLQSHLTLARGELNARVQQREDAAQTAYNLIQRERFHARDAQDRIRRINVLLTEYADTAFVKEHDAELREIKAQSSQPGKLTPEGRLRGIYGTALSFPASGRALIAFDCTLEGRSPWEMGDWKRAAAGWSADRRHSRKELENETLWPRLVLSDPLDLDAAMVVEIEFEQPHSSGPPQRFVASVAGWHVGFVAMPEGGGKSLVASTAGGVSSLRDLHELLDDKKGAPIAGLERGRRYVLRMELSQGRGKLIASLNGERILTQDQTRPEGRVGSYSIVVRSIEEVLLKAVRIEAGIGKR